MSHSWPRKVYVRGLSDGYEEISAPAAGKPSEKYKALRLDYRARLA
jgi:hypothetical protein